jgi:hypothetical protein
LTDIPNGMLIDKFPITKTVIIVTTISFLSQILTAIFFQFHPFGEGYKYILFGLRAFFGMAGSSAFTIQGLIISQYGKKYFELLMGVCLCVPFVFDAINSFVSTAIYDAT